MIEMYVNSNFAFKTRNNVNFFKILIFWTFSIIVIKNITKVFDVNRATKVHNHRANFSSQGLKLIRVPNFFDLTCKYAWQMAESSRRKMFAGPLE